MPQMLVPEYVTKFSCIGPACSYTCCQEWTITLDKTTYTKYKQCTDPAIESKAIKGIVRTRAAKLDAMYGKIHLDEKGYCPFFKEGLCSIQLTMGEKALSPTCNEYPRKFNQLYGVLEKSLTLSCPEAARLALLPKEPMQFVSIDSSETIYNIQVNFQQRGLNIIYKPAHFLEDIRAFMIRILQNRLHTLEYRLTFLGLVMRKIHEIEDASTIPDLLCMYEQAFEEEDLSETFHSMEKVPALQLLVYSNVIKERTNLGVSSKPYHQMLMHSIAALKQVMVQDDVTVLAHFSAMKEQYYDPYMAEHEHILENYLVNEVFSRVLPFEANSNVWEGYTYLILVYAVCKYHLVGRAAHLQGLDDDSTIECLMLMSRALMHLSQFLQNTMKLLHEQGWDQMAALAILIRD